MFGGCPGKSEGNREVRRVPGIISPTSLAIGETFCDGGVLLDALP